MRTVKKSSKNCFVIAEASANHGGVFSRAVQLIREAKKAGADAIKFQAYTADTMTLNLKSKHFMIRHPKWGGQSLYELYKRAYTPWKWFRKLKRVADHEGIIFFASPFDKSAVDMLEELDVPLYKIASFELVDIPLIEYVARTKKPMIMSTGMATLNEVRDALGAARHSGAKQLSLLKCVSSYPSLPHQMNLKTIPDMKRIFSVPIGLSDHTLGNHVAVAAVALGAQLVEKHFILSRKMRSPDNFFSAEPKEFCDLVHQIRETEAAVGAIHYGLTKEEKLSKVFRRSLFVSKDIQAGDYFTGENICSIRPAFGLAPKYLPKIIGARSTSNLKKGTPLRWQHINQ